jgi:glycosyltransferase involved in cell wall biosynthesis
MKRRVLQFSEKLAAWCAHVVLCNSESLLEEAKGLGIAGRDKLCVIGDGSSNGVNVERFCPGEDSVRSIYGIPADDPVVGFVGRLTRDKGVLDLIVAFEGLLATVPNAWLLLVGWFDESEDALSVVEREWINSHPRVVRTGFVDDAALYYRAMDVMVLPTWREGFPNVVLEAGASGIPVISTLSTGSRDAVLPEVTGLLIPPGYPEAILEAMLDLLGNRERRLKMGKAAHAWVLERFANQRVLGLTVAFYQEMARDATAERIGETITVAAATAD